MNIKDAALVFDALSQETRLTVFRMLIEHSETGICPCDIAEKIKIPRNTLSFHLSLLSQAGLCFSEKKGKMLFYKPNCHTIKNVMNFLHKDCIACNEKRGGDNKCSIYLQK